MPFTPFFYSSFRYLRTSSSIISLPEATCHSLSIPSSEAVQRVSGEPTSRMAVMGC